jgi:(S)-beta-tyrosine adenylation enzyme
VIDDTATTDRTHFHAYDVRQAVTSFEQDALWFLNELSPDSPASNVCRAYRICGPLDIESLRSAWRAVVHRHEVLRTTLHEIDGRPVQWIAAAGDAALSLVDLSEVPPHGAEARAERLCAELAATPFDLAEGPLARVTLARLSATEHVLLLVLHQAIADDRSMSILADELSEGYAAAANGRSAREALPVLPFQYADHARARRERAATPGLLSWWTSTLTPAPRSPELPVDRARPAEPSFEGGVVRFDWGQGFARALAETARAEATTPFALLLAGYQCLLHRYSAEEHLAVGVPVSQRPGSGADRLVGPFLNTLLLPADFSGAPAFGEVLRRTTRLAREASDRREPPFADLVQVLNPDRDPRRVPMCDVVFSCQEAPESELRLAGASVRRETVHNGATRADLTLTVDRTVPSVAGSLEYRSSLFEAASAEAILGQLRTLLAAAMRDPGLPVDALPLEDADGARAAVREADRIDDAAPADVPVHALVRGHAERAPDSVAVAWDGRSVTYRELVEQAASVAGALRALGGVKGTAVAVRVPPGPAQMAALLGVLEAGAHLVWFGTGDAGERGRVVLSDLRPAALLLDGDPAGDALATWYRDELAGRIIDVSTLAPTAPVPGADLSTALAPRVSSATAPGDRAYVAYTSGSTGRPKGIAQSHGALAQFATWMGQEFRLGPGARMAQWVAPEHDPAIAEVFATLVSGGTLCPVPERVRVHPEKLADWLTEQRITHIQTVPSFAKELLRAVTDPDSTRSLASLGHLLLMGEALPEELANGLLAALPSTRLINLYGPTETVAATWHEIAGTVHGATPIGLPIPGRQVLVLDELDRPCPAGVTGDLVIRSPYVTPGYIGAGSAAAFEPLPDPAAFGAGHHRCYRTGDLGRRRWDGRLEFRGRRDFQVKLSGNRVELTDIEATLAAHDSVAECAVAAVTDPDGLVTRLVIYVVPRRAASGEAVAAADVWRAHLRRRFGTLAMPASFKTLSDHLPRNVAGKVDRRRLPDPGPLRGRGARMPQTPVEKGMAAIWRELLEVEQLSAEDTFFAAGGHSLLVPRLAGRIREWFGVEVPLRDLYANPSLAAVSAVVASAGAAESGPGDGD